MESLLDPMLFLFFFSCGYYFSILPKTINRQNWLRWLRICLQSRRPEFKLWVRKIPWGMANHSSILALRIPWTEEPGGLQSMGSQRVGQDWATNIHTYSPTPTWITEKTEANHVRQLFQPQHYWHWCVVGLSCIVGCLAAFQPLPTRTNSIRHPLPPSCDNQKWLQIHQLSPGEQNHIELRTTGIREESRGKLGLQSAAWHHRRSLPPVMFFP